MRSGRVARLSLEYLEDRLAPSAGTTSAESGLDYLRHVMDLHHVSFPVYKDVGSPGNHFVAYALIPNELAAVDMNGSCTVYTTDPDNPCAVVPHSGATAIRARFFNTTGSNFGGIYFQNGVLGAKDKAPKTNFGEICDAGITTLKGAKTLTFWVKGEKGGEQIEFFVGGVGRDPLTGEKLPGSPCPDSTPRYPKLGTTFTLSSTWQKITIDVSGLDLSYVLGGFGWVASALKNPNGATFYLDDVQYELNAEARNLRLNEPRFLRSYTTLPFQSLPPPAKQFDLVLRNTAFTYDNVLAVLAFLADRNADTSADSFRRAKLIGEAFLYALDHDRTYLPNEGKVRSAYMAGDHKLPPGWTPNNKVGTVPIPGFYLEPPNEWFEVEQGALDTGNNAWAMLGSIALYERTGDLRYREYANKVGKFIQSFRETMGLYQGFKGGIEQPESSTPTLREYASSEHNLDIFAAFSSMFELTGDQQWQLDALHAKAFMDQMWDHAPFDACYLTGTNNPDELNTTEDQLPVDVQAWSTLAIPSNPLAVQALACAETHHLTTADGFTGFDFNNDKDGVWFEGTGQMAVAYAFNGLLGKAESFRTELRRAQLTPPFGNQQGIAAASHDGLTTGFGFEYCRRWHVGATAWNVFAQLAFNPYYQDFLSTDVAPLNVFAVGGASVEAGHGLVQIRRTTGNTVLDEFAPYGTHATGGVTVAVGDVNNDGYDDVVTGAAAGNPHVKAYDGKAIAAGTFNPANPDTSLLIEVFPFALQFNVGANVAVGDIDNDGYSDLVVGATIGNPHVKAFSGKAIANGTFDPNDPDASVVVQFFAFGQGFNVGTTVDVGDVNGDSFADLVAGATPGNPHVKAFDGKAIAGGYFNPANPDVSILASFFAFELQFNVGASVAIRDVDSDGYGEIIVGAAPGNPHVKAYSGKAISAGLLVYPQNADLYLTDSFFADELGKNIGVRVGAADFDLDGDVDFLTAASTLPRIRAFAYKPLEDHEPPFAPDIRLPISADFDVLLGNYQGGIWGAA